MKTSELFNWLNTSFAMSVYTGIGSLSFPDLKIINYRNLCFQRAGRITTLDQLYSNHGMLNDNDTFAETSDL